MSFFKPESEEPPFYSCPFCGNKPYFTDVEWKDDSRYIQLSLECCVSMSEAIGWYKAKDMTISDITSELKNRLSLRWNTRAE